MQPIRGATAMSSPSSSSSASSTMEMTPEVFCNLGSLIVEGRVPRGHGRGFGEGPHVPPQYSAGAFHRHECSEENYMCKKDENFRKHMLLLWQNNVPVCIEILLCPDCRRSRKNARSIEFSTIPEPGSILLEQWTVAVKSGQKRNGAGGVIASKGLFQAVRSYLHFSELSAWYSSSAGEKPKNVLYRITIPGETFASKFPREPEEHIFPEADAGRGSTVRVSVRSLPRSSEIPRVECTHKVVSTVSPSLSSSNSSEDEENNKLGMAGALVWAKEVVANPSPSSAAAASVKGDLEGAGNLRKAALMSRLEEDHAADDSCSSPLSSRRSDSMDSMLGDSLLDPPQSLQKIAPRRYQSPSRCGSPSLETPEHLLFGRDAASRRASDRCARQDLIRRRDINLFYGMHPRLLHSDNGQRPRLSLPASDESNQQQQQHYLNYLHSRSHAPRRPPFQPSSSRRCNISGKHICSVAEETADNKVVVDDDDDDDKPDDKREGAEREQDWTHEYLLQPSNERSSEKGNGSHSFLATDESGIEKDSGEDSAFMSDKFHYWQKSPGNSRRASLKDAEDPLLLLTGPKKRPSLHDIFDDGTGRSTPPQFNPVTQVYRAETVSPTPAQQQQQHHHQPPQSKAELLLSSIVRTSERNQRLSEEEAKVVVGEYLHVNVDEEEEEGELCDKFSSLDTAGTKIGRLDPLDLSFDNDGVSSIWSDELSVGGRSPLDVSDEEVAVNGISQVLIDVPSSAQKDTFRKSFDSATSMVFHRRTGLPLTSSPAPLRKGKAKFDFDSTISSPNDIKRALFRSGSSHKFPAPQISKRKIGHHQISTSAPATVTSSNLLGSFEESVLNGRLEPVSTVEGFTAEIGASGSFHPKHSTLPVTVFFYTLCDNNNFSSPYLGHINLGKRGYRVPDKGTLQVTLFNPLGTVVKMFVVLYDLSDMPPNSQTFLRQRTLYMPSDDVDSSSGNTQKWLRYLIHLRFASSKSGKIYLHTDMRMIIFRKSDLDTAAEHSNAGKGFELRSFTRGPSNPKFSPRK